jgi:hypothetical protein
MMIPSRYEFIDVAGSLASNDYGHYALAVIVAMGLVTMEWPYKNFLKAARSRYWYRYENTNFIWLSFSRIS